MGNGAVDDAFDTGVFDDRHTLQRPLEPGHQAVEVIVKQFAVGLPFRQAPRRPGFGQVGVLVNADEPGLLFLAQVGRSVGVAHHRYLFLPVDEFLYRPGHEIVVLDIADRQVRAHHLRHLSGIAAGRVHHAFRNDDAVFGYHFPFAGGQGVDVDDTVVPDNPGAHVARAARHGVGQPRRVRVAVVPGPRPGQDAVGGDERVQLPDLVDADDLHVEADVVRNPLHVFEPIEVVLRQGKPDAARGMPAYRLPGEILQLFIQGNAVLVDFGEVVIADKVRALAGRMPGRTGSEFAFLNQDRVGATLLGQVIEQPDPHDAAADDDDTRMTVHPAILL